jgi:hypothetical protein
MPTKTDPRWKKHISLIKDAIYIILFLAATIGWISSKAKRDTKLETQVEHLIIMVQDQNKQLQKINDMFLDQKELNGKIIQFIDEK